MQESSRNIQVLPYLRIISIEYPTRKQGLVGVLIDENELLKSFDGFSSEDEADTEGISHT